MAYAPRPLIPIPVHEVPRFVGRKVHHRASPPGCVWVLEALLPGDVALLRTPVGGHAMVSAVTDLCFLRKAEPRVHRP